MGPNLEGIFLKIVDEKCAKNEPNSFVEIGDRVKRLYESGKSRKEIASELGISRGSVRIYGSAVGIGWSKEQQNGRKKYNKNLEEITSRINEAIANGANSITSIIEKTNYSYAIVKKYAETAEIELPKWGRSELKERSNLDSLIEQGLSLKEIGEVYGVTAERVRQIIKAQGKTEIFKTNRRIQTKPFKESGRKEALEEIFECLTERTNEFVKKEGWAYEKAIEYLDKHKQHAKNGVLTHSFDDLLTIFERYEGAEKNGQKLSLMELSNGTNYHFVSVGKILSSVGVSSMHGDNRKERALTPEYKKEAIRRSVGVDMSSADIAYFLGILSYIVENSISQWGLREKRQKSPKLIKQFGSRENHEALNYRLASEIYEAKDKCKFNLHETAEVLDVSPKIIKYALKHRNEIEPVIIDSLRILYNDSKINEPYKKSDF